MAGTLLLCGKQIGGAVGRLLGGQALAASVSQLRHGSSHAENTNTFLREVSNPHVDSRGKGNIGTKRQL